MTWTAMPRSNIHRLSQRFQYIRLTDSIPPSEPGTIDVAVLDMNHSWPNLGHNSIVHAVLECAETLRPLTDTVKLRVLSFDVRRRMLLPAAPNGRFSLYVGTGGPGHLDPRQNDGVHEFAQGINESDAWEKPLFNLFDAILHHPTAAMIGICHSFGLLCRWSGAAHTELRTVKSSGMPTNALTPAAADHPWFSRFASELPDQRHFRVVDNRLFDLVFDGGAITPIAFESERSNVLTMAEFARGGDMPRVWGVNHHPEIVDREHILRVLKEKHTRGDVTEEWFRERSHMLEEEMRGENERQSRLTSEFTFLGVLRHHIARVIEERE
jgi:hypothetical protein